MQPNGSIGQTHMIRGAAKRFKKTATGTPV
jgi:ribosomal protein L35